MADTLQHVTKGQERHITADAWNSFCDAARYVRERKFQLPGGGSPEPISPTLKVMVQNSSGAACSERYVLAITGQGLDAGGSSLEFDRRPLFTAGTPTSGNNAIVILSDPLAVDAIGQATIAGVCCVDIDITDTGHQWAVPINGNNTRLVSGTSGPARILWKATVSPGVQRCVVNLLDGQGSYVAGSVGLKGQANSLPTTPEGPRATANLIPFTPAIGSNFSITLVDDPGNDRLNWTLNNLGLFVVDTASAQVGPRRQLHFLPDAVGIVRIVVADDAVNDEVEVAVDLDPPGLPYAVLWTDSGGNVIAWTDDPEVVRLTARSEIVIGVPSDTTGILKFKDEFSSRSFDIQASGQGASQNLNLPQSLPTVRQFLQAYTVAGADVQAKWVGMGLSTSSIAGLTVVASIDNWEQIRFSNEFFEVFGNDAGTPANSTYGIVNLKKGLWVGIATSDLEMRGYDVYMNNGTGTGGGDAYMDGGYVYMCDGTGTGGGDFYMDGGIIWMHAGGIAFGNGGIIYAGAGAPAYPSIDPYNRQLWGGASHVSLTWNNDGVSMGGKRIEMNTGGGTGGGDIYMDGGKIKFTTGDIVDQAAARADSTAATLADLVTDFNDLLAKLRTAGIIKT